MRWVQVKIFESFDWLPVCFSKTMLVCWHDALGGTSLSERVRPSQYSDSKPSLRNLLNRFTLCVLSLFVFMYFIYQCGAIFLWQTSSFKGTDCVYPESTSAGWKGFLTTKKSNVRNYEMSFTLFWMHLHSSTKIYASSYNTAVQREPKPRCSSWPNICHVEVVPAVLSDYHAWKRLNALQGLSFALPFFLRPLEPFVVYYRLKNRSSKASKIILYGEINSDTRFPSSFCKFYILLPCRCQLFSIFWINSTGKSSLTKSSKAQ